MPTSLVTSEVNTERHVHDPADFVHGPCLWNAPWPAYVCREAGATVKINTKLRDMNLRVPRHRGKGD